MSVGHGVLVLAGGFLLAILLLLLGTALGKLLDFLMSGSWLDR